MKENEFTKLLESMKDAPEMTGGFEAQDFWNRFATDNDFSTETQPVTYGFRDYLEFYVWQFSHVIAKPMAVSFAVFALLIGGFVSASNFSFDALPGDSLYKTKLSLEKAQLAIAFSPQQKAKLQVEFTSRRLEEMVELAMSSYKVDDSAVRLALQQFKKEVDIIRADLKEEPSTTAQTPLAKEVRRKLPTEIKTSVKEVQTILDETQEEAVQVIITAHESSEDAASTLELQSTFEKELAQLQTTELNADNQTKLQIALALQKEGAYRRAFQVLKEVRQSLTVE